MAMNMVKVVNKDSKGSPHFLDLRFERKFIFQHLELEDLINFVVLTNSFGFKEIYAKRSVNNIYFDDSNFSFYKQNVSGDGERKKYRLRWYNNIFPVIESPTMEIKRKYGEVGDKVSFKMEDFKADLRYLDLDGIHNQIANYLKETDYNELTSKFDSLSPSIYNSYDRKYFLSYCEKFRITLDFNMVFFNPNVLNNYNANDTMINDIVLELKYSREHDTESRVLSQQIGARLSKNSKYVRGIDSINL